MNDFGELDLRRKKLYQVQCGFDATHIFEKVLVLTDDPEEKPILTDVEAFCPFCNKLVEFKVMGDAILDHDIIRRMAEQDEFLASIS